jgi:hypothetical protein
VIPFRSSDVWLFLSIAGAPFWRPAPLDRVFFYGDAINRDIFTSQQLRTGFAKLTAAGLVEEKGGRFRLTADGRRLHRRCRSGGLRSEWSALERELSVGEGPVDEAAWPYPLTDQEVSVAYQKYVGDFEVGGRFWRRWRRGHLTSGSS